MQQSFEAIMVDVILHLREEATNKIPDEDHLRF